MKNILRKWGMHEWSKFTLGDPLIKRLKLPFGL